MIKKYKYGDEFKNPKSKRFFSFEKKNLFKDWVLRAHLYSIYIATTLIEAMKIQKLNSGWEKIVIHYYYNNELLKAIETCKQYTYLDLRDSIKKVEKLISSNINNEVKCCPFCGRLPEPELFSHNSIKENS